MKWFEPDKRIEIIEQEDKLLVRAVGIKRVGDFLIPIVLGAGMEYFALRNGNSVLTLFGLLVVGLGVGGQFRNRDGEITITKDDLTASGDQGEWETGYVRFRWMDISGEEYQASGEDSAGGLYARTGWWSSKCLMAGLNREQSEEVIAAIYRRFPYLEMAEDSRGWSLFGGGSEIMTLGLSKTDESSTGK